MTVFPSQLCLPSRRNKARCCKICSPTLVASSLGNPFHCIKYSLIVLFLNFLSFPIKTFSGTKTKWPSSSKGGSSSGNHYLFPYYLIHTRNMKNIMDFVVCWKIQLIIYFTKFFSNLVGSIKRLG